jgi:hypothetical protein
MTWLRPHWKAIVVGVVAFSIGAIAGASGSSSKEATTVTLTTERTIAETVTEIQAAPKPPPPKPPPPAASSRQRFSGNGGKTLAPLTVATDSTLVWTNDGGIFQIFEDNLGVPVNSQAKRGSTFIPAGRYTFQVNALGSWTIEIR